MNSRILMRLLPNATLEVIRGGGHLFVIQEAEQSAALIRRFLEVPERAV